MKHATEFPRSRGSVPAPSIVEHVALCGGRFTEAQKANGQGCEPWPLGSLNLPRSWNGDSNTVANHLHRRHLHAHRYPPEGTRNVHHRHRNYTSAVRG